MDAVLCPPNARLLHAPVTLSSPSYLPFPPGYQMVSFSCDDGDNSVVFHVLFDFHPDGQTLNVLRVGRVEYDEIVAF